MNTTENCGNLKTFYLRVTADPFRQLSTDKTNFNFSGDVPEIKKNFLLIQKVLKNSPKKKFIINHSIWSGTCGQCEKIFAIVIWNFASHSFSRESPYLDTTKLFLNHADPGLSHTLNLLCFPFLHINHSVPKLLLSLLMNLNQSRECIFSNGGLKKIKKR